MTSFDAPTRAAAAALIGFAANSILCRMALGGHEIDAWSFTAIRLCSGALVLWSIVCVRARTWSAPRIARGNVLSALALFVYAAAFSLAYLHMSAGVGALVLFGSVQVTMIGWSVIRGARLSSFEWIGIALALVGLAVLGTRGSLQADSTGIALMILAGVAWGVYSLRGRASAAPLVDTAKNFVASVPLVLIGLALGRADAHASREGVLLALGSGVVASGIGYSLWYLALPAISAARAAIVQLCVPVIAALAGVALLGETLTARLVIAGALIVGGLGLSIAGRTRRRA